MPKRGRHRKKNRTHVVETADHAASTLKSHEEHKLPKSLVIRRGKVEAEVVDLERDLRKMMLPYTALHFRENARDRKATMSHYARELTAALGVTHIAALSQNGPHLNLRLGRTPAGPTLAFKVKRFSLSRQVRSVQRKPYDSKSAFKHPPVVVTNNFGDATAPPHVKLMRITFQNMFPAINVATVKLADCRRVVLFNLIRRETSSGGGGEGDEGRDEEDGEGGGGGGPPSPRPDEEEDEEVEVRHYAIRATPVGVNRKVRRIVQSRIPNLSKLDDVADYITGKTADGLPASGSGYASGAASDSEPEDETSHVTLSQRYTGRGNGASQRSALKLVELGPRLRLKLFRVQRGVDEGDVMYHAYVKKTGEEVREQRDRVRREAAEKRRRREEQEANVRRKTEEREGKREAKRRRKEEREKAAMDDLRGGGGDVEEEEEEDRSEEERELSGSEGSGSDEE